MNKKIEIQELGLQDFKQTWEYQEKLFKGIHAKMLIWIPKIIFCM